MNSTIPFVAIVGMVFWWLIPKKTKIKSNPLPLSKHKLTNKEIAALEDEALMLSVGQKRRFASGSKIIPESVRLKIATMYQDGHSMANTAKKYGTSVHTVSMIVREYNIPIRYAVNRPDMIPPNIRKKVADEYKKGKSPTQIAKDHGISAYTVQKIAKEYQLVMQRGKEINTDIIRKIFEMREKGYIAADIAKKLGIGEATIWRHLKAKRKILISNKNLSDSTRSQIISLYNQGLTAKKVANKLNISESGVFKTLKRFGIKARYRQGKA